MIEFVDPIFWIIVIGSFVASFVNAAFALGGAFIMLAIMTSILPISAVIPLHTPLLFGSLMSRTLLFWQHIHWSIVFQFSLGCLLGVYLGARIYVDLPEWIIASVLGVLMLSVWMPNIKITKLIPKPFFHVGVVHSFMSTVFAYGGLFHVVVLRTGLKKMQITATLASSLLTMGVLKITGYTFFGFDYTPYTWVIVSAIGVSIIGTYLGKKMTHHISEDTFRVVFKSIMTLFGLRLLYQATQLF